MFRHLYGKACLPNTGRIVFRTVTLLMLVTACGYAQTDPGIRGGSPGAGKHFATGMTSGELALFTNFGVDEFSQVEDLEEGLGPRFNLDSCGGCHAFPAMGGSSPPTNNPQFVLAPTMAPGNLIPSFIKVNGPVREVRFIRNPDGTPDGGVHGIFTISGRPDKPAGCAIKQPDFSNTANMSFRIPTPVFGAGLMETISDYTIRTNLASDPTGMKKALGIKGHVNTNGNDGTVTRFGWKAQNKSLLIFSGEAYNVEMGVTNENFPNEREEDAKCAINGVAEDQTGFDTNGPSNIVSFMAFMRFLDQPKPACSPAGPGLPPGCSASINSGNTLFSSIGCAACHTPTLMTGKSPVAALSQKAVNLFSDLAVHHMGAGLSDGVSQGSAGPDEFRTAPLWGVGQRAFFLHDGRTSDLVQTILAHSSTGSEAVAVVARYNALTAAQRQDLLNFLRSL